MTNGFCKFCQECERWTKHHLSLERIIFQLYDYIPPAFLPSQETQIKILQGNLFLCFLTIFLLLFLLPDYRNTVFVSVAGYPSLSDVFMVFLMFSFAGAFSAFIIRNKPDLAVLFRCYFVVSMFSMASALSILAFSFLELVVLAMKSWQSKGGVSSLSSAI